MPDRWFPSIGITVSYFPECWFPKARTLVSRVPEYSPISQVFRENIDEYNSLFYTGRFDFVVYEKVGRQEYPILAIELDGKEHLDDEVVRRRDAKKNQICESHGFQLIRVENSYARRYNYIKDILSTYFDGRNKAVKVQVKRK